MLGTLRKALAGILLERNGISADVAVRLGVVLGNGPNLWLNLQKTYDLWHAEREVDTSKLRRIA